MRVYKTAPEIKLTWYNSTYNINTEKLGFYANGEILIIRDLWTRIIPNSDFILVYFDEIKTVTTKEIISFCLSRNYMFSRDLTTGTVKMILPRNRIVHYYPYQSGLQK